MRFMIRSAALALSALRFAVGATTPFSGGTAAGTTSFSF
jgi:hypothetical protein